MPAASRAPAQPGGRRGLRGSRSAPAPQHAGSAGCAPTAVPRPRHLQRHRESGVTLRGVPSGLSVSRPPTPPQPRGYHGKRDTGWPAAGPGSLARPRWEKERRKRRIWGIHAVTVTHLALSGCQRGTHGAQSSSALVAAVPPPRCLARHPPAGRGRAAPRRLARCSSWGCSATGNQTWVTRWQIAPRWCHPAQGYPLPGDPLPAPCL